MSMNHESESFGYAEDKHRTPDGVHNLVLS